MQFYKYEDARWHDVVARVRVEVEPEVLETRLKELFPEFKESEREKS